jgi:hypothetical protein
MAMVCAGALALAEILLQAREGQIRRSDRMDPGLIRADPFLGWRLTPGWTGTHEHHDFRVSYRIDAHGFRWDEGVEASPDLGFHAVVGDSFTFGLGVDDTRTFVHHLNRLASERGVFVNFGVPGYSTDQEFLLIEETILDRRPASVWVMVYLANDFFDNQRPVPLQVRLPKPFFDCHEGSEGLELRNSPVALGVADRVLSVQDSQRALMEAVFGRDGAPSGPLVWLQDRSALARLATGVIGQSKDYRSEFESRFAPAFELFGRIVERMAARCRARNVSLHLGILPGRSFIEQPQSFSGQYQEVFRAATVRIAGAQGVPCVDIAGELLRRRGTERGQWFHANDGHFTARGHEVIAGILVKHLADAPR